MKEKNVVVVGTGFSGTVIARKIAEELSLPVTVVEKRSHIAGNMYDEFDEHNILVQKYGPHVLVTNHWKIVEYLSQYSEMEKHTVKELSYIDGKYIRLPFNFESVQQLIGEKKAEVLISKLREKYKGRDRVPVLELANSDDSDISDFGNLLFEKSYRTYCAKQWDVPTESLDKTIMDRVPMAMSYDERYMNKDFQFIPAKGFTELFRSMLDHPNITVRVNEDALEHIDFDEQSRETFYDGKKVDVLVYTGALDELFGLKYGDLPYRSLDIKYEWFDKERIYPESIISYPQAKGYTRRTEYRYLMPASIMTGGGGLLERLLRQNILFRTSAEKASRLFTPLLRAKQKSVTNGTKTKPHSTSRFFFADAWRNSDTTTWTTAFCMRLKCLTKLKAM